MTNSLYQQISSDDISPELTIHHFLDRTIKPVRNNREFVVTAIPYTPPKLIREMFNKIPPIADRCLTAKIAVIYTVEMAIYLSGLGFEDITLITREYDDRMAKGANKFGYKYILEQDVKGMKFDVIVGNPPYAGDDKNTDTNLWALIVSRVSKWLNVDGSMAWVTPQTWLGKDKITGKADYSGYTSNTIEYCEWFDTNTARKYFPTVNTTISWYIIKKGKISGYPTEFVPVINHKKQPSILHEIQWGIVYPSIISDVSISLHQKLCNAPQFTIVKNNECHGQTLKNKRIVSDIKTEAFPHPVHYSPTIVRYTNKTSSIFHTWKVSFFTSNTFDKTVVSNNSNVNEDGRTIIVSNKQEANNCIDLLRSRLYKYIGRTYRKGRNLRTEEMPFPHVDLSQSWTDQELYTHFNLTPEEINLIETTIK